MPGELTRHTGIAILPLACPAPRVSWGASSPLFLSSPSQQLLGAPQCTVLGPVSWREASGTRVEAAAAAAQPAGPGVLPPGHAGGHGPALRGLQVPPCLPPQGDGRRGGKPGVVSLHPHHLWGLYFCVSPAKNGMKLAS